MSEAAHPDALLEALPLDQICLPARPETGGKRCNASLDDRPPVDRECT
jgi:hypothetical protein